MIYQKKETAKATVGESRAIAASVLHPAILAARWALAWSLVAVVVSAIALTVAVIR